MTLQQLDTRLVYRFDRLLGPGPEAGLVLGPGAGAGPGPAARRASSSTEFLGSATEAEEAVRRMFGGSEDP